MPEFEPQHGRFPLVPRRFHGPAQAIGAVAATIAVAAAAAAGDWGWAAALAVLAIGLAIASARSYRQRDGG